MSDGNLHTGMVTVRGRAHPLADTVYAEAPAGQTIAQLLGPGAAQSVRVELGGEPVPRQLWPLVKPKAGQQLTVTAVPAGGSNNKLLKIVVVIVAIVYLYYTWDFQGALQIVAYGFTAVNLLVPPPTPKLPGAGDPFDTLNSLTGTQNRATVYSPIPCVIGTVRFFPTHAALPYTEIIGSDQYLRMMLDLGPGDLDVSDIQIGETPIGTYDDVEWEITTSPTLYTNDIYELGVAVNLNASAATATRAGQAGSREMTLDLQCPSGLFGVDNKGRDVAGHIAVTIEYRVVGTTPWLNAAAASGLSMSSGAIASDGSTTFTVSSSARKAVRVGVRWSLPTVGQYEVRVTRGATSWDASTSTSYSDMTWTVLRSVSSALPSTTGTTKLALRIRATDQLNSVVSTISVLASQRIRTYDPATGLWTTGVATSNNAWVYHWLLTAAPPQLVARLVPESRVDIDAIVDWAADCDAMGYVYNALEESGRTQFDLLRDVLASSRATFGMRSGKYSCVRDVAQTTPVQMFTPRNSWEFSGQRLYFDPPHALRCQFTNPAANNQQDELVVYADGYSVDGAGGTTVATRFEEMDLRMCTDPVQVWRLGKYHLKASELRTNTYSWMADMEHLVCDRGQLVTVANDIVEWGAGSARIKTIAGDRLSVTLDGAVTLQAGLLYAMQVRRDDAVQTVTNTTTTGAGDVATFAFAAALAAAVKVGDLCIIGERTLVSRRLIVQRIQPQQDLTARLTGVDEAPDVPAAGTGTPPPFVSGITGTPWCAAPPPPDVNVRISDSAANDAGVIHAVAGISGAAKPGIHRMPLYGGGCPTVDSMVIVVVDGADTPKRAGDVVAGDVLRRFDPRTLAPSTTVVTHSEQELQPCVEITTAAGKVLRCSTSAPIPTRRGGLRLAPNVGGHDMPVRVDGAAAWSAATRIRSLGLRAVQHISCNDGCFWVDDCGHHNKAPRQALER